MEIGRAICVLDPEEARQRDAMMRAVMADPGLAPPPPPPPTLGDGVWRAGDPDAGQLSHQGIVTYDGRTGRFDDVVGSGWTLIGRGHDPSGSLSEPTRMVLADLGGRCINVDAVDADVTVATDVEGTYAAWFDQMGVDTVLIRPDGYVAAAVPSWRPTARSTRCCDRRSRRTRRLTPHGRRRTGRTAVDAMSPYEHHG